MCEILRDAHRPGSRSVGDTNGARQEKQVRRLFSADQLKSFSWSAAVECCFL